MTEPDRIYNDEAIDMASTNDDGDDLQVDNTNEESSFDPEDSERNIRPDGSPDIGSPNSGYKQKSGKKRMPSNGTKKKKYQSKKIFNAPIEVTSVYQSVALRENTGAPINNDISTIRQAWLLTASRLRSAEDLNNIWQIHKSCLYEVMENATLRSSTVVTDDVNVDHPSMSTAGIEPNLE